jgi:DNA-directed RNA polymerase subunit K/omega
MFGNKLTKYEKTRIIGTRATQLSNGAIPTIDINGMTDPLRIAEQEYKQGTIPISVIRKMPDGKIYRIDINSKE